MIKGFFFDLDGTLVDTHLANFEAYKKALADIGVELTFDAFKGTIGMQAKDFMPILAPDLTQADYDAVAERKAGYYEESTHLSKLNHALLDFIEYVKIKHVVAIVTTARGRNAEAILNHHDIRKHFEVVITNEDVAHSKPAPDAYQLALTRTGLSPEEVIAFEDSETGRQAAEAAGIAVVMITDFNV